MKSFGLCHEIISPVILKSFGLSQDLPLSQNGHVNNTKKRIFANTIIEATNSTHHILYCIMCSEDLY